ncbi:hypothetical protein ACEWY4_023916 [Coilia grayii]|uniref:VWFD domain-containing protein n=1 Tax=Coilia grayii TaxID=363190 RepID=A0ABD1IYU8_9TELE
MYQLAPSGSACPATCWDSEAPTRCQASCVETCTCDMGFVRNGDKCIPQLQCGHFHKATESYVSPEKTFLGGWFAVVLADFGLRGADDWEDAVLICVPSGYSGAMCGLCGNYNYKQSYDMTLSNTKKAVLGTELRQSWRVAEIPGCMDGCKGPCPNRDITEKHTYEAAELCGRIRDPNRPFRKCHPHVDFESCLYDVCLHHGERRVLCHSLKAYTAAC